MYWWFPTVALYQMFNGAETKMCFARLRSLLTVALVQNVDGSQPRSQMCVESCLGLTFSLFSLTNHSPLLWCESK